MFILTDIFDVFLDSTKAHRNALAYRYPQTTYKKLRDNAVIATAYGKVTF